MNKADLVDVMQKAAVREVTKADTERMLNAFMEAVKNAVVKGDDVSLVGFGTFTSINKQARVCRNPQTGKKVKVAACKAPKFKASQAFKDVLK